MKIIVLHILKKGIKYIQNKIGFKNLIITDDISMGALNIHLKKMLRKYLKQDAT